MYKRAKQIRKNAGLNQTEFGKRIGMTRDNIANIELNRAEIKDVFVKAVCREFNVNEEWLRTGNGEMYNLQTDEVAEAVSDLLLESNPLYDMIIDILRTYHSSDEKTKETLKAFIIHVSEDMKKKD